MEGARPETTLPLSFSITLVVASYLGTVLFLWPRVRTASFLGPAVARRKEERGEPAEGEEETGKKRGSFFTLERGRRTDEKKEKKGVGVGVCRGVLTVG